MSRFKQLSNFIIQWYQAHPVIVYSIGALLSAISVGITLFFTSRATIPDWVSGVAAVFLSAGTLVMLITTFRDSRNKGDK